MEEDGNEKILDHLWTVVGASSGYTYNVCTMAASDSYRDLGRGWQSVVHFYDFLMDLGDPRVAEWPLMASPLPTIAIIIVYLYLTNYGPNYMGSRKPFELRPFLLAYNAIVAVLNLYIGVELFLTSRSLDFNWSCQPVDYSNNPLAMRVASALW